MPSVYHHGNSSNGNNGGADADDLVDPDAWEVINDPEVERLGANAAVQYATAYWTRLCAAARQDARAFDPLWSSSDSGSLDHDEQDDINKNNNDHDDTGGSLALESSYMSAARCTREIRLSTSDHLDDRLHKRFRSNLGPYWNVQRIRVSSTINPLSGPQWTALLVASEGVVDDYNFMTLLRADCYDCWTPSIDRQPEGLLLVSRAQFVFIELTRCREGYYNGRFRRVLQRFDLQSAGDRLEAATGAARPPHGATAAAWAALADLRTQWPYPHAAALRESGVVRAVQRVLAAGTGTGPVVDPAVVAECRDLLRTWRDTIALGRLSNTTGLTDRQSRALQRAVRAMTVSSSTTPDSNMATHRQSGTSRHNPYVTKNTGCLTDVTVSVQALRSSLGDRINSTQPNPFALPHETSVPARGATTTTTTTTHRAAQVFGDYGVVVVPHYCVVDTVTALHRQARDALTRLQTEHLGPRGLLVNGDDAFDFVEVRQRPGHRVDNRCYMLDDVDSPVAVLGRQLVRDLPRSLFGETAMTNNNNDDDDDSEAIAGDDNGWKLLYAGVVHAFARSKLDDPPPPAQFWHRDGPSLWDSQCGVPHHHHHATHCVNVFVPLVDLDVTNGTTELIPGTHEDARYQAVVADVILAANDTGATGAVVPEAATIRATVPAGSLVAFDIRVLHRGLANASNQDRPVLYFTLARRWFDEQHMFQKVKSLYDTCQRSNGDSRHYAELCRQVYRAVTGDAPPNYSDDMDYGHPHYTTCFDLLLLEHLIEAASSVGGDNKTDSHISSLATPSPMAQAMANVAAVLKFAHSSAEDRDTMCQEFVHALERDDALELKRAALSAARDARRKPSEEEQSDFASIETDMSDVAALYRLTSDIVFGTETSQISKLGLTRNEKGLYVLLALLKAFARTSSLTGTTDYGAARIEDCFTTWWHAGNGRSRFELFSPHRLHPDSPTSDRQLVVVFSSLGSGIARPEWKETLRLLGVYDMDNLDVLHVMDFAFSWYCQGPKCDWNGNDFYEQELKRRTEQYQSVLFIGDSMGASGALRFSSLADQVLAFTPQVDLERYPAVKRRDFTIDKRRKFKDDLIRAVDDSSARITIHFGEQCLEDVRQVGLLPRKANIILVRHEYDDHILSLHLRDEGKLTDVVYQALETFVYAQYNRDNTMPH